MIELLKGNVDNLQGNVIVFSRLEANEEEKIVAFYMSTNPLDFLERFALPREALEEMERQTETLQKKFEQVKSEMNAPFAEAKILKTYCAPMDIENEADLYLGEEDVLYMGKYSSLGLCLSAAQVGVQCYLLRHEDNLIRQHHLEEKLEEKKPTYKDVDKDSLEQHLLREYVVPLIDSYTYRRQEDAKNLTRDLIRFSSRAPFASDVLALLKTITGNREKPDMDLVEVYLKKIAAINKEDYETAARVRDQINSMKTG